MAANMHDATAAANFAQGKLGDQVGVLIRDPVSFSGLAGVYAEKAIFCVCARLSHKNKEYCVTAPCSTDLEIDFQTTA